jgi:hypothetical protein
VVEIFARVAAGDSMRSVSRWLAGLPAAQRGDRLWPHRSVQFLVQSPTYIARPAEGDEDVLARPLGRWPALVEDEVWARVEGRIARHARLPRQASERYLLTGFLRCDRCGSRMVGNNHSRKGPRHSQRIYRCTAHSAGANAAKTGCQRMINRDALDRAVIDVVGEVLSAFADTSRWPVLRKMWAQANRPAADSPARRLARLARDLERSKHDLATAGRVLFDPDADPRDKATATAMRDEALANIDAVEAVRRELQANTRTVDALPSLEQILGNAGGWLEVLRGIDVRAQRDVLDSLVEQVVPRRVGFGKYAVDVTWTPLGRALTSVRHKQPAAA